MGIKIGMMTEASLRKLYIPLKLKAGEHRPMAYAKAFFFEKDGQPVYALRYLNGVLGRMRFDQEGQLEATFFQPTAWVPTREQWEAMQGSDLPADLIVFDGKHPVYEVTEEELKCLPPAKHLTDEDRFRNPRGLWDESVAFICGGYLKPTKTEEAFA